MRTVQMPAKKEWVLPQRHFKMAAKKVDIDQQTDDRQEQPPETERYLLQIDRQTKR